MLQATRTPNSSFEASFHAGQLQLTASPAAIRELAAKLVQADRLQDAAQLIHEAQKFHPLSEDLLVMQILLSEVQNHWQEAAEALARLVEVQGEHVTAETWRHWVRVLRCAGQAEQAYQVTLQGLQYQPQDALLNSELMTLESLLGAYVLKKAA